jgi:hypothetical protein
VSEALAQRAEPYGTSESRLILSPRTVKNDWILADIVSATAVFHRISSGGQSDVETYCGEVIHITSKTVVQSREPRLNKCSECRVPVRDVVASVRRR